MIIKHGEYLWIELQKRIIAEGYESSRINIYSRPRIALEISLPRKKIHKLRWLDVKKEKLY